MYDILVPVISNNVKRMGRETIVSEMNRIGSNRIFIASGPFQYEKQNREATLETLKENCTYFKENRKNKRNTRTSNNQSKTRKQSKSFGFSLAANLLFIY